MGGSSGGSGGSAAGAVDLAALVATLQKTIEEGLAPLKKGGGSKEGGGSSGEAGGTRSCGFCGRKFCQMLSGGHPCHEANLARKLLRENAKDGKKGGDPKGDGSKEDASK